MSVTLVMSVNVGLDVYTEWKKIEFTKEYCGGTQNFGEFDHKKFLTVTPSFHRLLRSSPPTTVGRLIHKAYCLPHLAAEGHTANGSDVLFKFPELLDMGSM
jgi:hypothetical protein